MYEGRIESSLHKHMNEFERRQLLRGLKEAEISEVEPAQASPSLRDEAATRRPPAKKKGDLKKQSQFVPAQVGAKSYVKGDYENKPASRVEKNKAKQSQFEAPALPKGLKQKSEI